MTITSPWLLRSSGAVTWAAWCLSICLQAYADDSGDVELLKKLSALWSNQRTAVHSAVIEYRSVLRDAQPKRKQADVSTLIEQGNWVVDQEALRSLILKLDASLAGAPDLWGTARYTTDGADDRADRTSLPIKSSLVHSGAYDIYTRLVSPPNENQIDIYARGQFHLHMPSIREFNHIPSETFCRDAAIDRADQSVPAGRMRLRAGNEEAIVDEDTGFVYEYHLGTVNDRSYQEVYQFAPSNHGDIVLPNGIFSGRYRSGELNCFTIVIIDNATLNQAVPPGTFSVSGKQGDIVVDRTVGDRNATELDRNVADILNR